MSAEVVRFQPKSFKSQAMMVLHENDQIVFKEVIRIIIKRDDFPFWKSFLANWLGAIAINVENNESAFKDGQIPQADYISNLRYHGANAFIAEKLHDRILEWEDGETGDFTYSMNSLDCFYIPSMLDEYINASKLTKNQSELYLQVILHGLANQGNLEERLGAIEELVLEYIENIEKYH